jgi:hypothetical protein
MRLARTVTQSGRQPPVSWTAGPPVLSAGEHRPERDKERWGLDRIRHAFSINRQNDVRSCRPAAPGTSPEPEDNCYSRQGTSDIRQRQGKSGNVMKRARGARARVLGRKGSPARGEKKRARWQHRREASNTWAARTSQRKGGPDITRSSFDRSFAGKTIVGPSKSGSAAHGPAPHCRRANGAGRGQSCDRGRVPETCGAPRARRRVRPE